MKSYYNRDHGTDTVPFNRVIFTIGSHVRTYDCIFLINAVKNVMWESLQILPLGSIVTMMIPKFRMWTS